MSLALTSSRFAVSPGGFIHPSARRGRARHVALAFPLAGGHLHQVVRGIAEFAAETEGWIFSTFPEPPSSLLAGIGWRGSGLITALTDPADVRAAEDLRLPCVNISSWLWEASFPRVSVDNTAVGHLAAEHLLARGFRRFACYAMRGVRFSDERERGFVQRLHQAQVNGEVATLRADLGAFATEADEIDALRDWLRRLEYPVAVFAANDERACMVIEAANSLGLRVPEQVAVLGVDNDPIACAGSNPPLSSIMCDWRRQGYEAAALLQRLMDKEAPEPDDVNIPPLSVASRRSTDVTIVDDCGVARAVDYVRTHLGEVFGVEALLMVTGVPRRSLEIAFKRAMGCTPYEYILRARVERAKELMADRAKRRLTTIATECGFSDLRRFRLVFRRATGQSPQEYMASLRR